jgi:hypothetical protein
MIVMKWGEEFQWESVADIERNRDLWYAWRDSIAKALDPNGWGFTSRRKAIAAVRRDAARMAGWCNDDWGYVGVIVTHLASGKESSLWSIESDCEELIAGVLDELMRECCPLSKFGMLAYEAAHAA